MSDNKITALEFVKNVFTAHLEAKNIGESYKCFTEDADIFGLVPTGNIHGLPAIKAALKTFLTFSNVNCTLTYTEET